MVDLNQIPKAPLMTNPVYNINGNLIDSSGKLRNIISFMNKMEDLTDNSSNSVEINYSSIDDALEKLNLKNTDENIILLNIMIENTIPLTKKNVYFIKNLIDFINSISENPKMIDTFVTNFIANKGIDINTDEGKFIESELYSLCNVLMDTSPKEIAIMMGSDIAITTENIQAFKNLSEDNPEIYTIFNKIEDLLCNEDNTNIEDMNENIVISLCNSDVSASNDNLSKNAVNEKLNKKFEIATTELCSSNIKNTASNYKTVTTERKNIDFKTGSNTNNNYYNINTDADTEVFKTKSKLNLPPNNIEVSSIEKSNSLSKKAPLDISNNLNTKVDFSDFKNIIKTDVNKKTISLTYIKNQSDSIISKASSTHEDYNLIKNYINNQEIIKNNQTSFASSFLETLTKDNYTMSKSINDFIKNVFIFDKKLENTSLSIKSSETILKDISLLSKDNFKEALQNIFKDIHNLELDQFISKYNSISKSEKFIVQFIKEVRDYIDLLNGINENLSCNSETLQGKEIKHQILDGVNTFKGLISKLVKEGNISSPQIADILKNNINTLNTFAKLSDQLYMLNLPISFSKENYNCKLMIKDDRRKKKRNSTKELKLVASVKTVNMGFVDAYITLINKNIDVELKAESKYINILSKNLDHIKDTLTIMGFTNNIIVTERKNESIIVNTSEFFNYPNSSGLNIRV